MTEWDCPWVPNPTLSRIDPLNQDFCFRNHFFYSPPAAAGSPSHSPVSPAASASTSLSPPGVLNHIAYFLVGDDCYPFILTILPYLQILFLRLVVFFCVYFSSGRRIWVLTPERLSLHQRRLLVTLSWLCVSHPPVCSRSVT